MPSEHHRAAYNASQKAVTKARSKVHRHEDEIAASLQTPAPEPQAEPEPPSPTLVSSYSQPRRAPSSRQPPSTATPSSAPRLRFSSPDLAADPANPLQPSPALSLPTLSRTHPCFDRDGRVRIRLYPTTSQTALVFASLALPLLPPPSRATSPEPTDAPFSVPACTALTSFPASALPRLRNCPPRSISSSASPSLSHITSPRFFVESGGSGTQRVGRVGDEWQGVEDEVGEDEEGVRGGKGRAEGEWEVG
ncbi:hypothetical protein MMC27_000868 [Xylographa pallens]|nr:hypothetical protein [Xylographa pallens]